MSGPQVPANGPRTALNFIAVDPLHAPARRGPTQPADSGQQSQPAPAMQAGASETAPAALPAWALAMPTQGVLALQQRKLELLTPEQAEVQGAKWDKLPEAARNQNSWYIANPHLPNIAARKSPRTYGGKSAKWKNLSGLMSYKDACAEALLIPGGGQIGFMLQAGLGLTCIDMDVKHYTPPEKVEEFRAAIKHFDSYTEKSQSGQGFHTWSFGEIGKGCRGDGWEVYSQARFIICTGDVFLDRPIRNCGDKVVALVTHIRQLQNSTIESDEHEYVDGEDLCDDDDAIASLMAASNGEKFQRLWHGNFAAADTMLSLGLRKEGHPDANILDMSVVDHSVIESLAWARPSNAQVCRLFAMSPLSKRAWQPESEQNKQKHWHTDGTFNPRHTHMSLARLRPILAREKSYIVNLHALLGNQLAKEYLEQYEDGDVFVGKKDDEILAAPDVSWILHNLIPSNTFIAVYGKAGGGKSFLILDLLGHIANGRMWFNHKIKVSVPVFYFVLEDNEPEIKRRLLAWKSKNEGSSGITFFNTPLNLAEPGIVQKIVRSIKVTRSARGILTIDTLARSMPGFDENNGQDMSLVVSAADQIMYETGWTVIVVHHSGKDESKGMRGHSSLVGAVRCEIEVSNDAITGRQFMVTKSNGGPTHKQFPFKLNTVSLGFEKDDDGEDDPDLPISSCVVEDTGDHRLTDEQKVARAAQAEKEKVDRSEDKVKNDATRIKNAIVAEHAAGRKPTGKSLIALNIIPEHRTKAAIKFLKDNNEVKDMPIIPTPATGARCYLDV